MDIRGEMEEVSLDIRRAKENNRRHTQSSMSRMFFKRNAIDRGRSPIGADCP